jgi:minor histocompatibility antigen H13
LGIGAVSAFLKPIFTSFFPVSISSSKPFQIKFQIPFTKSEPYEFEVDYLDILGGFFGAVNGFCYFYFDKNWIANNLFGEAFSVISIELLSLGSFKIAFILLWGLFFYDIFWVFGTDVMETVAKSFEGPIKVIWPRGEGKFSLLGLGDIVIPGFFIAMMLRFDAHLSKKNGKSNQNIYFKVCFISYVFALITTVYILHTFQHGQPALLYIVPFIIFSVLGLSVIRGEFSELINYSEEKPAEIKTEESKKEQ